MIPTTSPLKKPAIPSVTQENPCKFQITFKNGSNKGFNGKMAIVDGITHTSGGVLFLEPVLH